MLPKLIYPLTCLSNPPEQTIQCIERLIYSVIWDGKPEKLKRNTFTQNYDRGRLKIIDIEKIVWSLKISNIKRLVGNESETLLKSLYSNHFKICGGHLLFEYVISMKLMLLQFLQETFFTTNSNNIE